MTVPVATLTEADADRALKGQHRAMWALGDYPAVAASSSPALGPVLVAAAGSARATGCSMSPPAPATSPSRRRSPAPMSSPAT